jgi:WD40 repeat protein
VVALDYNFNGVLDELSKETEITGMVKEYFFLFLMICLLSITGCQSINVDADVTRSSTQPLTPTENTFYLSPSDTPTDPSNETLTVTVTPTVKPTNITYLTVGPSKTTGSVPICQGNGKVLPKPDNFSIDGTIVYHTYDMFSGLYTYGGNPLHQSQLPVDQSNSYEVFGFSPDGKWLAYMPIPPGAFEQLWEREFKWEYFDLFLLSDSREKIEHKMDFSKFNLNMPKDEFSQQGPLGNVWINDHLIYTNLMSVTKEKSDITGFHSHYPAVFDPFSGTWYQELIAEFPDEGISKIAFSSDLSRALYYKPPNRIVLWNLSGKEVIWENNDLISSVSSLELKWSPDDSMAIIANRYKKIPGIFEFYLMTRNGEINRIIANSNYPTQDFYPIYIEWSPDSRLIAMSNFNEVYIYDVGKDSYLFVCPFNSPSNMIWSPNNRYLAMGEGFESLRILDIENGNVIELIPYGIPVGWSATFPTDWP